MSRPLTFFNLLNTDSMDAFALQVVWHSMQDEFIKQIKYFESMITKCYPDSGITFEFTIDSLLGYFSDIAQLH